MTKENLTPDLMAKLAKVVDHMLNPTTKGETGFCVFVYPHEPGDIEALYVSNSQVDDVKKAVKTWLEREETIGQLGASPSNKENGESPSTVRDIRQAITVKYQGKRVNDTQHSEEFDYLESRDWQAIYHYPDRFKITGDAIGGDDNDGLPTFDHDNPITKKGGRMTEAANLTINDLTPAQQLQQIYDQMKGFRVTNAHRKKCTIKCIEQVIEQLYQLYSERPGPGWHTSKECFYWTEVAKLAKKL